MAAAGAPGHDGYQSAARQAGRPPKGGPMARAVLVLAFAAACLVIRVRRQWARQPRRPRPGTVTGWLRELGLGSWLLPVAMLVTVLAGPKGMTVIGGPNGVTVALLLLTGVVVMLAPRLSAWLLPFALLILGLYIVRAVTRSSYWGLRLPLPLGLPLAGGGSWRTSVAMWQALA